VEQFGVKQLRVAIVTSSRERVQNMLAVVNEITEGRGSNFFLFVDRGTLAASNPLDVEWVSGKGEVVKVTDWSRTSPLPWVLFLRKLENADQKHVDFFNRVRLKKADGSLDSLMRCGRLCRQWTYSLEESEDKVSHLAVPSPIRVDEQVAADY
jgi:hypothetical protein